MQRLTLVCGQERGISFDPKDDAVVDQEISPIVADAAVFVCDSERPLPLEGVPTQLQFVIQRLLISSFQKSRPESSMDFLCCPHDRKCEFFVKDIFHIPY